MVYIGFVEAADGGDAIELAGMQLEKLAAELRRDCATLQVYQHLRALAGVMGEKRECPNVCNTALGRRTTSFSEA